MNEMNLESCYDLALESFCNYFINKGVVTIEYLKDKTLQ